MAGTTRKRVTRANGEASRRQILDAAAALAAERGFAGTSISAVAKVSGLPHSSIYWHFENKDALICAVIEDSYGQWKRTFNAERTSGDEPLAGISRLHSSLAQFPDFLRLGLLMTLERGAGGERAARRRFLEIRREALEDIRTAIGLAHPGLPPAALDALAGSTLALIDGGFIAGIAGEGGTLNGAEVRHVIDAAARSWSTVSAGES